MSRPVQRHAPGTDILRRHIGMVLAECRELPDGTTAFGFHTQGFSKRPWRWVSIVTGDTATEWVGGHTPTNLRDIARSQVQLDEWQQHQDDIGIEMNERELRDECDT